MYIWRTIQNSWYYLKCYFLKKYNRVVISTLPPTWNDRDTLLSHAMFQILSDFIEKEKPARYFDLDRSEQKEEWAELFVLYDWWNNIYLKFDAFNGLAKPSTELVNAFVETDYGKHYTYDPPKEWRDYYRAASKKEQDMYNELTEKMKKLIDLRHLLWT